jgi:hypothetical protein
MPKIVFVTPANIGPYHVAGIFPGQEVPKTFLDCGGQGCCIISD